MQQEKIEIPFKEGHLALWKITTSSSQTDKNVFLTHGTFSNKQICLGISEYLVHKSYTCWVLEWRNHGSSSKIQGAYNFEIIGKEEVQRAFQYLFEEIELDDIDCVTHSGGGIALSINLVNYPANKARIKKMVFFGCQAFGACENRLNYWKVWMGEQLSRFVGHVPARLVGRPENESYNFMKLWNNWNLSGQFLGENGIDYALALKDIQIPILSISGAGDTFIAPRSGCESYLNCFNNPVNQLLHCAKETGFKEDYTHSRLIYSQNAKNEIYPKVYDWIG